MKILVLISTVLLISKSYAIECDKIKMLKEIKVSKNFVYGIGQSNQDDFIKAKEEARARSYQDLLTQISVNVRTQSVLNETESSADYNAKVEINSELNLLNDVSWEKEFFERSTYCALSSFDVEKAYKSVEGELKILEKKMAPALEAKKKKDYIEIIRLFSKAKEDIDSNEELINKGDAFKDFLKKGGKSWREKFKNYSVEINNSLDEAKKKVTFFIEPFPKYDEVVLDTEALLSSQGYKVQIGGNLPKTGIAVEFKEDRAPKPTTTALGFTVIYKFSVIIKDLSTKQVLGASKDTTVQGFSNNSNLDEALASASRQMTLIVDEVIKNSIPGALD